MFVFVHLSNNIFIYCKLSDIKYDYKILKVCKDVFIEQTRAHEEFCLLSRKSITSVWQRYITCSPWPASREHYPWKCKKETVGWHGLWMNYGVHGSDNNSEVGIWNENNWEGAAVLSVRRYGCLFEIYHTTNCMNYIITH